MEREDCPCLDLSTGHRLEPGETTEAPDGCNNWSEYYAQGTHTALARTTTFNSEKRNRKLMRYFLFIAARVKVEGSTAPETPVQVSKTSCKFLYVLMMSRESLNVD